MPDRLGTRLLGSPSGRDALFGRNFGEDWVVPRAGIRYLVLARRGAAGLLSAYDGQGRLVGERFADDATLLEAALRALAGAGDCEPLTEIPGDAPSALVFLDRPERAGANPPARPLDPGGDARFRR